MSVEAITCALRIKLPPGQSTAKHVLTILANHANGDPYVSDEVEAWPSIAALVDSTGQDRKTVITNLQKLCEWGLISDTGKRVGRTGQIVVYALHVGPDLLRKQSQYRNGSSIGTVPISEPSQDRRQTVPNFRGKGPDIGTRNRQEPSGTNSSPGGLEFHDRVGQFEGHATPGAATPTPTAAGAIARALREAGFRINAQSPDLLAAVAEGVTLEHIAELAQVYPADHAKCRGSPGYLLAAARRQRAENVEPATPVSRGTHATSTRSGQSAVDRAAARARDILERTGVGT